MKIVHALVQLSPEVNFITPNFDHLVKLLTQNFLVAILFFIGFVLASFLFYYSIGVVMLFWHRARDYNKSIEVESLIVESNV